MIAKKLIRWMLIAILVVFVLILLALAAVRFIVYPNIDAYKNDIAQKISQTLGQQVTIQSIDTGWYKLSPHLILNNIIVNDAQNRPALQLKKVEAIASWLSVPLLEPRLSYLKIHQPALTIRRNLDGSIFLAGIAMGGKSKPEFANWLLNQSHLKIANATIIWQDDLRGAPALSLNNLDLKVKNPAWRSLLGRHSVSFEATPSVGGQKPIVLTGSFVGKDITKMAAWYGKGTLQIEDTDLSVWRPWLDYPIDLQSGTGNAKIAFEFAKQALQRAEADVAFKNVITQIPNASAAFKAEQLKAKLIWQTKDDGFSVIAKDLQLQASGDLNIKQGSGFITKTLKNKQPWFEANAKLDQFNLRSLQQLQAFITLPETAREQITARAPSGNLNQLELAFTGDSQQIAHYKLKTNFSNVSFKAHQKIPGATNLSGQLNANEKDGVLTLATQNAMIDLKDILRWPIPASQLNGDISWEIANKNVRLEAKEISIASPHISGVVNAVYDNSQGNTGALDLTGKFGKGNAKFAPFYYPIILGTPTIHWLDTSILSGKLDDVLLRVKGNLDDFPFVTKANQLNPKLGVFRVSAKLTQGELHYGTSWPKIEDLDINLLFEGKRMELNTLKGRILGNKIIACKTEIKQLDADSPILHIMGQLEGPIQEGIKFVNESPVKDVTQGFTDSLKTAGNGKLALELIIPMQDLDKSKYKGAYSINNGTLFANTDVGLPELSKLNGVLSFTESNLTAPNIKTEILGGPAQFTLKTGADKVIYVTANGRMSDAGIKKLSSHSLTNALVGAANWDADIRIQKPLVDAKIRSDLVGMAVNLPAPMGKPASQAAVLMIDKKQASSTQESIDILYGNLLAAKLLRTGENLQITRGDVAVNAPAIVPSHNGISVHGNLELLDADAWMAYFAQTNSKQNSTQEAIPNIVLTDFNIGKLQAFGQQLNQLKLNAKPNNNGLQLTIDAQELAGDVEWQNAGDGKVVARLKKLIIADNKTKTAKPTPAHDYRKQRNYPALDIVAENLQIGTKKLGALELNAFESNEDWVIQKLKISNEDSTLNADGTWHNWTRNPNTALNFTLNSTNIGKTLARFGQPDAVKGGDAAITGKLKWPGSPHEFEPTQLDGSINLTVSKGQILKVKPGVGRLLGLISLQSLPRRLSLDFRDLFSDGFAFDSITATAQLDNGIMRSRDFFMTGPAAEAKIKGELNLQNETQNLKVKVIPHVSDTLSLAALAGGPIVGAAAFVAQKILKDPFNKIVQSEYVITGTWDNPQEVESAKDKQKPNTDSPLN